MKADYLYVRHFPLKIKFRKKFLFIKIIITFAAIKIKDNGYNFIHKQ